MDRLPELRKMRASSLTPELYGEISEFLSSVKPDLTISGRTRLYTIYTHLQGAKKQKLAARQLKKAEEIIMALCAAAEIRGMRFRAGEKDEAGMPAKKREKTGFRSAEGQLEIPFSRSTRGKFASLGITDEKAVALVLKVIGEEEFGRRYGEVVKLLPKDAYRSFFSVPGNSNYLCSSNFYEAVRVLSMKVDFIEVIRRIGTLPPALDYRKNPNALHLNFEEMNGMLRIVRRIDEDALARLSEPEGLRRFMEKIGFRTKEKAGGGYGCVRIAGGIVQRAEIMPASYGLAELHIFMLQAGISGKDMKEAGIVE